MFCVVGGEVVEGDGSSVDFGVCPLAYRMVEIVEQLERGVWVAGPEVEAGEVDEGFEREPGGRPTPRAPSLAVDLELTRAELRRTREERDRLKTKVQRALGQQVDQTGNSELEERIRVLRDDLQQRDAALAQARAEQEQMQIRLGEAEDTVAALRQSLKQMMRDQNA